MAKSISAGLDWYVRNESHIDDLLVARGLVLGGDCAAVPLVVRKHELRFHTSSSWFSSPPHAWDRFHSAQLAVGYYTNSALCAPPCILTAVTVMGKRLAPMLDTCTIHTEMKVVAA
jgi:hypothetical protein